VSGEVLARGDGDLVAAVADRDRGALHQLYLRHEPWLFARLSRRCADRQIVEEVVQDVFVKVWHNARAYEGTGQVAAWLWGIAIRTLLHRLRPRRPLLDRLRSQRVHDVSSAEEQVLIGVEHGRLGAALDTLSPELRTVVQATVLDGLTTEEAARLLGIPSGTVKTRMQRARRDLREALA
jgi:RNA polymerase sigma-70 factor (ECF subfamily)